MDLACVLRKRLQQVKEMFTGYDKFYPLSDMTWYNLPKDVLAECDIDAKSIAKLASEIRAISDVFDVEGRDAWTKFLEIYVNCYADPIEERDFKETIARIKRLIRLSEVEAKERWVYELKTKSGFKIYAKVTKDKIIIVWGDTYHVRDVLKKLKFQWDPVEKVWRNSANAITIDALKSALEPL